VGQVQNAAGTAATSGYVRFQVVPYGSSLPYRISSTAVIAPSSVDAVIDENGNIKAQDGISDLELWGNDLLEPANSTYQLTFAPDDEVQQVIPGHLISGPTYDLSDPVFQDDFAINPASATLRGELINANLIPAAHATFVVGSSTRRYLAVRSVVVEADSLSAGNGWTGTFATGDARTATVVDGIITDVS
jgi:hypothetical protein